MSQGGSRHGRRRPPLAPQRGPLRADGRVLVTLTTAWRDGTAQLLCEPIEFVETRAALTARPSATVLLSHGLLAPHARWRRPGVGPGRPPNEDTGVDHAEAVPPGAGTSSTPRAWPWPAPMPRVFALDVLICPRCGGWLRGIATVQDPAVARTLLAHLARSGTPEPPGPASPAPAVLASPPPALIGWAVAAPPPGPHGALTVGP